MANAVSDYRADPGAEVGAVRRAMILLTCTGVTFLYAMTVSIANVSLPQMQGALSATADQIAWVVTANIVATAVATPMSGWLTSRFGRRRLTLYCVIGFAVASLMCGLADDLTSLVIYRVFQGAFGAPLVPVSQAIILDTYPKRQHGTVIAIFGMGAVLGPVVGPVFGGYLSEAYNWRWVFFMILPFTVVAFIGAWIFVRDSAAPSSVKLDWTGFLSLAISLAALQMLLDRGERLAWFESYEIIVYALVACTAFYLFLAHSMTTDKPFLRPILLRDRNYSIGLVIVFVFGMLNFTPMTLLPPMLQQIGGYPDSIIGFVLGARGMGTSLAFFLMIWASRYNPRLLIAFGFLLQAAAGWYMATLDVNTGVWDIFWPIFWQGFGVGVLWVPITVVTFSTLKQEWVPEGTAVFHLLRNIGASIHISISVALVIRMQKTSYADIAGTVASADERLTWPWVIGGFDPESVTGIAAIASEAGRQALMTGYNDAFYFFVVTSLVVLPLVPLIRRQ